MQVYAVHMGLKAQDIFVFPLQYKDSNAKAFARVGPHIKLGLLKYQFYAQAEKCISQMALMFLCPLAQSQLYYGCALSVCRMNLQTDRANR